MEHKDSSTEISTNATQNIIYHWIDKTGQPRIAQEEDTLSMAALRAHIQQQLASPSGHPILVQSFAEGSLVEPITDPTKLLE
jgi:hypothetical protein